MASGVVINNIYVNPGKTPVNIFFWGGGALEQASVDKPNHLQSVIGHERWEFSKSVSYYQSRLHYVIKLY